MNPATSNSPASPLQRDQYGALSLHQVLSSEMQTQVSVFLNDAVKAGHLPQPYITSGKRNSSV